MKTAQEVKEYDAGYDAGFLAGKQSVSPSRYRPAKSEVIGISYPNPKRYHKLQDGNILDTETNTILIRNALQEILDY